MTAKSALDNSENVGDTQGILQLPGASPTSCHAYRPIPCGLFGPHPPKGVTLGDESKTKTAHPDLINRSDFTLQRDHATTWRMHNPDPECRVVKAQLDKRLIGERREAQTGNGLFDFSDSSGHNSPELLTEIGRVAFFHNEKSRGSGHSVLVVADIVTYTSPTTPSSIHPFS